MNIDWESNTTMAFAAWTAVNLLFFILVLVLFAKVRRLRKKMGKIIGNSSADNVDALLLELREEIEGLKEKTNVQADTLKSIRQTMRKMKSNVALARYNAFADQGSDLSFSVAIMDEDQNGLVLTGIHSREQSFLYAKPVEQGQSSYTLSPEEKKVIALGSAKGEV